MKRLMFAATLALPVATQAAEAPPPPVTLVPIATARPHLPDTACQQRLSGWVDLDYAVLPDGKVADARVTAAEPKGVFDASAIEAVSAWVYAPQAAPVKMHQRMRLGVADCRSEQMRATTPAADAPAVSQDDCPALADAAAKGADAIDPAESARAAISPDGAQAYSAPDDHCLALGRKFKPGARLIALSEQGAFTRVNTPKGKDDAAIWVHSNQLKDIAP